MRLICPNCAACYEIEATLIPAGGRDVQCSACGHAWFQASAEEPRRAEPEPEPVEAQPAARDRVAEEPADGSPDAPAAPPGRPRNIDPAVLDILRSEAEFEARARRSEAAGLESQVELGLPEAPPARANRTAPGADGGPAGTRLRDERENPADGAPAGPAPSLHEPTEPRVPYRPVGPSQSVLDPDEEDAPERAAPSSRRRRSRFPDPDSFDLPDHDPNGANPESSLEEVPEIRRMGGFRWGFLLAVGLLVLTTLLYLGADNLRGLLPAADPLLDGFVALVDGWRIWINDQIRALIVLLSPAQVG